MLEALSLERMELNKIITWQNIHNIRNNADKVLENVQNRLMVSEEIDV